MFANIRSCFRETYWDSVCNQVRENSTELSTDTDGQYMWLYNCYKFCKYELQCGQTDTTVSCKYLGVIRKSDETYITHFVQK